MDFDTIVIIDDSLHNISHNLRKMLKVCRNISEHVLIVLPPPNGFLFLSTSLRSEEVFDHDCVQRLGFDQFASAARVRLFFPGEGSSKL